MIAVKIKVLHFKMVTSVLLYHIQLSICLQINSQTERRGQFPVFQLCNQCKIVLPPLKCHNWEELGADIEENYLINTNMSAVPQEIIQNQSGNELLC